MKLAYENYLEEREDTKSLPKVERVADFGQNILSSIQTASPDELMNVRCKKTAMWQMM